MAHNVKNRTVSLFFHRSRDTISQHFHPMLKAVITLEEVFFFLNNQLKKKSSYKYSILVDFIHISRLIKITDVITLGFKVVYSNRYLCFKIIIGLYLCTKWDSHSCKEIKGRCTKISWKERVSYIKCVGDMFF